MVPYKHLSGRLMDALALTVPPVAVSFQMEVQSSAPHPEAPVPAGCKFWEIGSARPVLTGANDHRFCSVGIYTHNIEGAPESQLSELEETLSAMQGLDYVRPQEIESLPVLTGGSRYIQYGPLEQATHPPAVVLLFAQASQSLIVSEAIARVDDATPLAMGRPACALIPQVMNTGRSATSLGCCGARAYLDVLSDETALWGLVGEKLEGYVTEIETLAKANSILTRFHTQRRSDIESGSAPAVKESLSRL